MACDRVDGHGRPRHDPAPGGIPEGRPRHQRLGFRHDGRRLQRIHAQEQPPERRRLRRARMRRELPGAAGDAPHLHRPGQLARRRLHGRTSSPTGNRPGIPTSTVRSCTRCSRQYGLHHGHRRRAALLPGHDDRARRSAGAGSSEKIRHYRTVNRDDEAQELYDGLEHIVLGIQRLDRPARRGRPDHGRGHGGPARSGRNLLEMAADQRTRLSADRPETFREACQWMLWYQIVGKMYNMGGSLGTDRPVPVSVLPSGTGSLAGSTDEEAIFHLACHFVMDTSYTQLGRPRRHGERPDQRRSRILVLEAVHRLKVPVNVGVSVGADHRSEAPPARRGDPVRGQDRHSEISGGGPDQRGVRAERLPDRARAGSAPIPGATGAPSRAASTR